MSKELQELQVFYKCLEDDIYRELCGKQSDKLLSRVYQFGKLLNNTDLDNDENNCSFDKIVKSLKEDAVDLHKKFQKAKNANNYRDCLDSLRLLKDTLDLIQKYDWKLMYSEYETRQNENENYHKEIAVWEQNFEGNIRNHKVWEVKERIK